MIHVPARDSVQLLVLPHVHGEAGLLGEAGVTLLALVGLLPGVLAVVDLEGVAGRELLATPAADVVAGAEVLAGVVQPLRAAEELLGAVFALEPLSLGVVAPLVHHHGVQTVVVLAADVAHEGACAAVQGVFVHDVFLDVGWEAEGGAADMALAALVSVRHDPVNFQQVSVQVHGHLEDIPAGVAQVALLVGEQVVHLQVKELLAVRTGVDAAEGALRCDADVGCCGLPTHGAVAQDTGEKPVNLGLQ